MTRQLDVLLGAKALVARTLPGVSVEGLNDAAAAPERVAATGRAVIEGGDPGPPSIDLSPPTYNYEHQIPLELTAFATPLLTARQVLDQWLDALGAAIAADRQLGGLVDYLDAFAPPTGEDAPDGAAVACVAEVTLVASYSTTRPL